MWIWLRHWGEHPSAQRRAAATKPFAFQEYMQQRYGVKSDGLVLPQDAFIPGSKAVTIHGLDHLESTVTNPNPFKSYKPADITLGLVAMALRMPKEG